MRFIPDPGDETQAIDVETGRMAARVFFVTGVANPAAPTIDEVRAASFVGWTSLDQRDDA